MPGFINYPSFKGCNELIKETKAKLVSSAKDIADEFLWEKGTKEKMKMYLSDEERKVFKLLGSEKSLDELIIETKLNGSVILAVLTNLKIKELVYEITGGKYKGI